MTTKKPATKPKKANKSSTKAQYIKDSMENGVSRSWAEKAFKLKQLLNQ